MGNSWILWINGKFGCFLWHHRVTGGERHDCGRAKRNVLKRFWQKDGTITAHHFVLDKVLW